MVHREELDNYCNNFLNIKNFKDYGPNGLQIEGSDTINKIISGVSANLDLIERAIEENADAIFVYLEIPEDRPVIMEIYSRFCKWPNPDGSHDIV